jgi:hypothetical protein
MAAKPGLAKKAGTAAKPGMTRPAASRPAMARPAVPAVSPGGSQPGNGMPAAPGTDRYRDMLAGLMR